MGKKRKTRGSKKEYKFTWATRLFYSRNKGDETAKSVRRVKPSSIPKAKRERIVKNAGTWIET